MKNIQKKMLVAAALMGGFLSASPALAQDKISTMTCYMDNDLIINEIENASEKAIQFHIATRGKESIVFDFREEIEPIGTNSAGNIVYERLSYGTKEEPLGKFAGISDDPALTKMPIESRDDLLRLRARNGRNNPEGNIAVIPDTSAMVSFDVMGRSCYLLNANKNIAKDAATLQAMVLEHAMHLLMVAQAHEAYNIATYKENALNTEKAKDHEKSKKFVALSKDAIATIKLRKALNTALKP